jgi:hypothetical protein
MEKPRGADATNRRSGAFPLLRWVSGLSESRYHMPGVDTPFAEEQDRQRSPRTRLCNANQRHWQCSPENISRITGALRRQPGGVIVHGACACVEADLAVRQPGML